MGRGVALSLCDASSYSTKHYSIIITGYKSQAIYYTHRPQQDRPTLSWKKIFLSTLPQDFEHPGRREEEKVRKIKERLTEWSILIRPTDAGYRQDSDTTVTERIYDMLVSVGRFVRAESFSCNAATLFFGEGERAFL